MFSEPAVPDQVAVPLLFSVRKASAIFVPEGKLIPAFILVVALAPATQDVLVRDEHIVPPDQFSIVEKFRTPGAAPARVPALKFTLAVEIVVVPAPKFMVAPLKFRVPVPLRGPLCPNMPLPKLMIPGVVAVNIPEQVDPQFPPPVNENVEAFPSTVPVLLNGTPIVVVVVPPVFSYVPAVLNATGFPPPVTSELSLA